MSSDSPIVDFHRDAEGDWVADLQCGHTQHVRHRPPFELRPWVVDEEGRRAHLGVKLPCPFCRMPKLPGDVREYKRTAELDETSVPKGLLARHQLKAGTWGEIVVLSGHVIYVLEDDGDARVVLREGVNGTVAPERPHHVELGQEARFYVRFLRADPTTAVSER